MVRRGSERRLGTVLFVDIVDSTRIAADVGDERWRKLLRSFRSAVRSELRTHGGHEQDTAGDGFFATFSRPAGAVRAASAIVRAAQRLGIDVRCGVHTGELERIDGRLGGIAAHIGARVIGHARPAEILVTATVRDLVVGSGIDFETATETELKGVPGRWTLHRVTQVDRVAEPAPLTPDAAGAIIGLADRPPRRPLPRPRPAVVGVAVVAALGLVALGAAVLILPRDWPSFAGGPSSPAASTAGAERPITMLRIDAETNTVTSEVRDKYLSVDESSPVTIVDGALWQETPINVVRRDLETGEALDVIDKPPNTWWTWFAFGSIWFLAESESRLQRDALRRVNPSSGRPIATIEIEPFVRDTAFGRDAIYVLTRAGILEIDPRQNAVVDEDRLPIETIPDRIAAVGGTVWICECDEARIIHWDPRRDEAIRTVQLAQQGFVLDDRRELSQGNPVSVNAGMVWLLDGDAGTITPVEVTTGQPGRPLAVPRGSVWHDFGGGSVWISGRSGVSRIDLESGAEQAVRLPAGISPGGIAVDEVTGIVWVANWVDDFPGQN